MRIMWEEYTILTAKKNTGGLSQNKMLVNNDGNNINDIIKLFVYERRIHCKMNIPSSEISFFHERFFE